MDILKGTLLPEASMTGTLAVMPSMYGTLAVPDIISTHPYQGPYEITPSEETQILETASRETLQNITINPIPSNYGRIAWDGTKIRVF